MARELRSNKATTGTSTTEATMTKGMVRASRGNKTTTATNATEARMTTGMVRELRGNKATTATRATTATSMARASRGNKATTATRAASTVRASRGNKATTATRATEATTATCMVRASTQLNSTHLFSTSQTQTTGCMRYKIISAVRKNLGANAVSCTILSCGGFFVRGRLKLLERSASYLDYFNLALFVKFSIMFQVDKLLNITVPVFQLIANSNGNACSSNVSIISMSTPSGTSNFFVLSPK